MGIVLQSKLTRDCQISLFFEKISFVINFPCWLFILISFLMNLVYQIFLPYQGGDLKHISSALTVIGGE